MVLVRVSQNVSYKVFETLSKIKDLEFENKQQAVDKLKDLGLNDRELFEVVFMEKLQLKLVLKNYENGEIFEKGSYVIITKHGTLYVEGIIEEIMEVGMTVRLFGGKEIDIPYEDIMTIRNGIV